MALFDEGTYSYKSAEESWSHTVLPDGTYRFEVRDGDYYSNPISDPDGNDRALGKNRSEVGTLQKLQEGRSFVLDFDVMVERGATNTADWLLLLQFHQTEDVGPDGRMIDKAASPPLALQLRGERLEVVGRTDPNPVTTVSPPNMSLYLSDSPIERGRFYNIRFEMVFDDAARGEGELLVFIDGVQVVNYHGPLGYNDVIGPYFKFGVYREASLETFAAQFRNVTLTSPEPAPPIEGTAGADLLDADQVGFLESETLNGYGGNDTLIGGFGDDTMNGGAGDDFYIVADRGDVVNERVRGIDQGGRDSVQSYISYTLGEDIEDLTLWADANTSGTGNAKNNVLRGNMGHNALRGLDGDDSLLGDIGNDSLYGGNGSDTALGGLGDDYLSGDAGNDRLMGETGNDTIEGGDGNDTLEGDGGLNTLYGGLGDDNYLIESATDVVVENLDSGTDTLRLAVSFDPGAGNHIEVINTVDQNATTAINIWGTDLDNEIRGNAGTNSLWGRAGNDRLIAFAGNDALFGGDGLDTLYGDAGADTLDGANGDDQLYGGTEADLLRGGAGNDSLYGDGGADTAEGGAGNDAYTVDNLLDRVVELAGEGADTVRASASFDLLLTGEVEFLSTTSQTGLQAINLGGDNTANEIRGNDGLNRLSGHGGNDRLFGYGGNDTIEGGLGDDYLAGGLGNDLMQGGEGNDSFNGEDGADTIHGENGQDSLTGGAGADSLLGGAGNDVLHGGDGDDTLYGDAGADTVDGGAGADLVYGGTENNLIIGGADNDTLNGGGGADTMVGGTGSDSFIVDNSLDVIVELAGEGSDTVRASVSLDLGPNNWVEFLRTSDQTLTVALDLGGDDSDNEIRGNDGANRLLGRAGIDTIYGYAGNDTIEGGLGGDSILGGLGNDSILGGDGADTIRGEAGDDTIFGGTGSDMLFVSSAASVIHGDDGADSLYGGATGGNLFGGLGDDSYFVFHAGTVISESPGGGTDSIRTTVSFTLATTSEIEVLRVADQFSTSALHLRGSDIANELRGNNGNNLLDGRGGNDTMRGFLGDDIFYVDSATDVTVEAINEGNDTIYASVSYTIGSTQHIEELRTTNDAGTAAINLTGNLLANRIVGNDGANYLRGGDGDDTLTGLAGNDTVYGGTGVDRMVFGVASTVVNASAGASSMTLTSAEGVDFVSGDVEFFVFTDRTLTLAEARALRYTGGVTQVLGTDAANSLTGTENDDSIRALGGNDWITGSTGSDTVDGGDGRDMISFAALPDTPGRTPVQYRLDLDLTAGTATTTGADVYRLLNLERVTGSIFADRIKGSSGADELRGLGDYDWFIATTGADTYDGGTGSDMVSYVDWQSTAANFGTDPLLTNGRPPSGSQVSGVVVDLSNTANNTHLAAGHSYVGIERITGSGRADVFWGDANENDFRGLGDYDWFVGSAGGRERYFGGGGSDTVTYFRSAAGVAASLVGGARVDGLETGVGTAGDAARDLFFEIENLVGTEFGDTLTGNSGRNTLMGLGGNDQLFGGLGTDLLKGGAGNDTINGGGGSDYAIFDGTRAVHTITRAGATITVTGTTGTDIVTEVEYLRFADGDVPVWDL